MPDPTITIRALVDGDLAVEPSLRRRGVGSRLVEHALAALRRDGIPRCNIYLYDENEDGARFWRRHGWRPVTAWKTLQRPLS